MLGRLHPFGARQFSRQQFRFVDEHRQMLRADVECGVLIRECDQRYLLLRLSADKACDGIGIHIFLSLCARPTGRGVSVSDRTRCVHARKGAVCPCPTGRRVRTSDRTRCPHVRKDAVSARPKGRACTSGRMLWWHILSDVLTCGIPPDVPSAVSCADMLLPAGCPWCPRPTGRRVRTSDRTCDLLLPPFILLLLPPHRVQRDVALDVLPLPFGADDAVVEPGLPDPIRESCSSGPRGHRRFVAADHR